MIGPAVSDKPKYSKLGLITPAFMEDRGIEADLAELLAGYANCGLSRSTHDTYCVVINHLKRCEQESGIDMSLPFNTAKMLCFVGWMIKRGLKSRTMSTYISGLRMYHLAIGFNEPILREPIVKLILKGKENWEYVQRKLAVITGRLAVIIAVLKLIKKQLIKEPIDCEEKLMLWAICTILWNGSLRVHEALSKSQEKDEQTSLTWGDIKLTEDIIDGKIIKVINLKIKSPKVDRIGNGDMISIF